MTRAFIVLAASAAALCISFVFSGGPERAALDPRPAALDASGNVASPPARGAWKAFEWWYAQRAYPNPLIPAKGFKEAFEAVQPQRLSKRPTLNSALAPWESIGPGNVGGRVLDIEVHPDGPDTVWVGSASGGLWKSVTGGVGANAWTRVEMGYPALSISAITFDPGDPSIIYVGTGEISSYARPLVGTVGARSSYGLGILKSIDGGVTWDTTGLNWNVADVTAVQEIITHPTDGSILYAATSEGVYKSTDAGDSWTLSNPELMAMDIVINPVDPAVVISAHGNLNSTAAPGLYMTFNAGADWSKLTGGLPASNFGRTSLAIAPSDPDILYAGIANGSSSAIIGLYKSVDGGANWSLVSSQNYVGSQGWYDNIVEIHPTDPNTVYAAGFDIHKSTNSGANLPAISGSSVHVDHHAIEFHPSDPQIVYFGCDGGIYRTTNGGTSFQNLNNGFVTTQFYPGFANAFTDSSIAIGGLQDNGTLKYTGSANWLAVWGGDGGWCAIDPTNPSVLYAETQWGRIVKSINGGSGFGSVTSGLPGGTTLWNFIPPFVMSHSAPSVLYAGSRTVYKTTNGGLSWASSDGNASLNGTNIACIGVSWSSPDTLMTATGTGTFGVTPTHEVFSSTNGGATWSEVTGSLPDRYPTDIEFDPSDGATAYLTFSGYGSPHVFRTTNLGQSWTDITGNLPDIPHQAVVVDHFYPEHLYVGNDLGVWHSTDAGQSWSEHSDGMPDAMVLDLTISRSNDALRASTFGNGVYERALPRTPVIMVAGPNGGEVVTGGFPQQITWTAAFLDEVEIEYSTDLGASWLPVADGLDASAGSYDWIVPLVATTEGLIRVSGPGGSPTDVSDSPFSVLIDPDVLTGWNIVSVPLLVSDYSLSAIYPQSVSNAFSFSGGYVSTDTLARSTGYWVKFPQPEYLFFAGDSLHADSMNVGPGWNIIGSISTPVDVGSIGEAPSGLISSFFYEFRDGYEVADTILPGRGYWVKTNGAGHLLLGDIPAGAPLATGAPSRPPRGTAGLASLNRLIFSDASGIVQVLYFGTGGGTGGVQGSKAGADFHELPPPAPGGRADVRFAGPVNGGSGGRLIWNFGGEGERAPIRIERASTGLRVTWDLAGGGRYALLNSSGHSVELAGSGGAAAVGADDPRLVHLVLVGREAETLPAAYALHQNYPNPFNPTTTIAYSLPRDSRVLIEIFDATGRRLERLVDADRPAGDHTVEWNAGDFASGLYLCRMTAGGATEVRKMLLVR